MTIKYIIINSSIIPNRYEDEVVFLPGEIKVIGKKATFVPNIKYINSFISRESPMFKGGGIDYDEANVS